MIDEKKKRRFISEYYQNSSIKTRVNFYNVLVGLCEAEDFYQTDLCNFSTTQLNGLVERNTKGVSTNYRRITKVINDYLIWCNVPQRVTIKLEDVNTNRYTSKMYFYSFTDLYNMVNYYLETKSYSADAFYALMLYLSWISMSVDEMINLSMHDIDFDHYTIVTLNRNYYNVDYRILDQCEFCNKIDYYENNNQKLVDNDYIIRPINKENKLQSSRVDKTIIYHAYNKFNNAVGCKYTYSSIRKSGLFAYLLDLENKGEFDINGTQVEQARAIEHYFMRKPGSVFDYIEDYKIWKKDLANHEFMI